MELAISQDLPSMQVGDIQVQHIGELHGKAKSRFCYALAATDIDLLESSRAAYLWVMDAK